MLNKECTLNAYLRNTICTHDHRRVLNVYSSSKVKQHFMQQLRADVQATISYLPKTSTCEASFTVLPSLSKYGA